MGPLPERGVSLDQVDPDALPVRGNSVPGTYLRFAAQRLLAETARFRWGDNPRNSSRGCRHGATLEYDPGRLVGFAQRGEPFRRDKHTPTAHRRKLE
jgi:hypothetical protein